MRYKIWDKQETLVTPIGEVLTPDMVHERYPASALEGFKFIVCDSPISMGVFMEFTQTKAMYIGMGVVITDTMTDQEVLDAITAFEESPPIVDPSTEERTAAALEFLALNSMA